MSPSAFDLAFIPKTMGVDAEELILRPFRDVVDRGTDAITHAEAAAAADVDKDADASLSERMLKASRAVVREGERAVKKIQPIWDGQVEKYGDSFKEAMMEQGMSLFCKGNSFSPSMSTVSRGAAEALMPRWFAGVLTRVAR